MCREATSSPKKAVILGLLLLVALYYWAPLIAGLFGKEKTAQEPPGAVEPADMLPFVPVVSAGVTDRPMVADEPTIHDWRQIARWLDEDPATRPVADLAERRDPFRAVLIVVAGTEDDEEIDESLSVKPELTPETLGMQLSGTVVGTRRRVAMIGGKVYTEGRTVPAVGQSQEIEFVLSEVHPRKIVLERLGKRYELAVGDQTLPGSIELIRGN